MNKSVMIKRIALSFLTLSAISFIFINSSFDAVSSDTQSLGFTAMINEFLHSIDITITLSNYFVRKCAHFAEYFLLGTLLYFTVKSFLKKLDYKILIAPAMGLLVASVDETIQLFSYGRSGQISDVLLDFFGVCTAVLIFFLFSKMRKSPKDKEVSYE